MPELGIERSPDFFALTQVLREPRRHRSAQVELRAAFRQVLLTKELPKPAMKRSGPLSDSPGSLADFFSARFFRGQAPRLVEQRAHLVTQSAAGAHLVG